MIPNEVPLIFQRKKSTKTDAELLSDKASQVLAELSQDYILQVKKDIMVMHDLLNRAETVSPQKRGELIQNDFFLKMHDLKGQGSTFGYPLLTEIGAAVCDLLRHKKGFSGLDITLLKRYVNDADRVIQENLTGDGGPKGAEIRNRLKEDNHV